MQTEGHEAYEFLTEKANDNAYAGYVQGFTQKKRPADLEGHSRHGVPIEPFSSSASGKSPARLSRNRSTLGVATIIA